LETYTRVGRVKFYSRQKKEKKKKEKKKLHSDERFVPATILVREQVKFR
jgi:hypothetical protein